MTPEEPRREGLPMNQQQRKTIARQLEAYRYYMQGSQDKSDPVYPIKFEDHPAIGYIMGLLDQARNDAIGEVVRIVESSIISIDYTRELKEYHDRVYEGLEQLKTKSPEKK